MFTVVYTGRFNHRKTDKLSKSLPTNPWQQPRHQTQQCQYKNMTFKFNIFILS